MEFVLAIVVVLLILCLIAFLLENRKRKRLQEMLKTRNREKQKITRAFDALFQNIHAFVLLIDRNFIVHKTNYYERMGKEDDKMQKRVGELLCCQNAILSGECGTHERCRECAVRQKITHAFLHRKSFSDVEASLTLSVAENKYISCQALVSGAYINVDDEENMVLTIHDITELLESKQAAEKLQRVISFTSSVSQVGFAALDIDTLDEIITPEYCINFCEREDESANTIMKNFRYVHPEDREELLTFMDRVLTDKTDALYKDIRVMTGENEWKWVKIFLIQKEYPNGHTKNEVYSLTIDISEQKKVEEALAAEREKAVKADVTKSAFLANMSHEIRTPLNAIMGFSELLAAANSEEEKKQFLQILKTNTDMLLQLINDILDMSKIEAGTLDFSFSEVDMNVLMQDMESLFKMRVIEDGPVDIIYEPSDTSCIVRTDRNRIGQVISNFMSNAIKFTEAGVIRLGFKSNESGVYVYVADTGLGIPEEQQDNVFGRFARFHKEKQGNGLGLSISKTIVEKLGGEIGFDSVYGKGSTFWFKLPANTETASSILKGNAEEQPAPMENETVVNNKKPTILIAEDMEDNYQLCEAILAKKYHLLWAHNGEEAVSMFLEHHPDVILMDLKMPVVDGYEATAAIRQMSTAIPIVALTAFAFAEDKKRVQESGFTDYLTKPVSAEVLLERMKTYSR